MNVTAICSARRTTCSLVSRYPSGVMQDPGALPSAAAAALDLDAHDRRAGLVDRPDDRFRIGIQGFELGGLARI